MKKIIQVVEQAVVGSLLFIGMVTLFAVVVAELFKN